MLSLLYEGRLVSIHFGQWMVDTIANYSNKKYR